MTTEWLTGITYPNTSTNSFVYNDLGQRTAKVDSAGTLTSVYDGSRVLADSIFHTHVIPDSLPGPSPADIKAIRQLGEARTGYIFDIPRRKIYIHNYDNKPGTWDGVVDWKPRTKE